MYAILAFLLMQSPSQPMPYAEPSLDDLNYMPYEHECEDQIARCQRWKHHLQWNALHHGNREQFEQWEAALDWDTQYWELLRQAHQSFMLSDEWRLTRLEALRDHIGPYRYNRHWRPILIDMETERRLMPTQPIAPGQGVPNV